MRRPLQGFKLTVSSSPNQHMVLQKKGLQSCALSVGLLVPSACAAPCRLEHVRSCTLEAGMAK